MDGCEFHAANVTTQLAASLKLKTTQLRCVTMPVSAPLAAKRALVKVLLALAALYEPLYGWTRLDSTTRHFS